MRWLGRWRDWARQLKREVYALYLAYRDPRTPLLAKVLTACVVGYALSPIDLIPDPIPILGYLDDLVIVPLGILLVRRMIPAVVMADCRQRAQDAMDRGKPVNLVAAGVIIAIWVVLVLWMGYLLWPVVRRWL